MATPPPLPRSGILTVAARAIPSSLVPSRGTPRATGTEAKLIARKDEMIGFIPDAMAGVAE